MQSEKKFLLAFVMFLLIFPSIYSQPKEIIELLENHKHNLMSYQNKEFENMIAEDNFENHRPFDNLQKYISETTDVVDSIIVTMGDGFIQKYKYLYNGKMISKVASNRRNVNWGNFSRETYTYDTNGNRTSYLREKWENENWVNYWRETYTYDANGNRTSGLYEYWYSRNENWVNDSRDTYTYDTNGNKTSRLFEKWENENWVNDSRSTYTYDTNGNRTSRSYERWKNENRVNYWRETYTYDTSGNRTSRLFERWENENWVNGSRDTSAYDTNGNRTSYLREKWKNENWVNDSRDTSAYDTNGNRTSYLYERWKNENWVMSDGYLYLIDLFDYYHTYYCSKAEMVYKTITDINENNFLILNYSLSQNYPNPFNPSTTISYTLPKNGLVQLKIYDLLGREVVELVNKRQAMGNYKVEFNASNLTSGIYFYKLQSGDFAETKKLILLR